MGATLARRVEWDAMRRTDDRIALTFGQDVSSDQAEYDVWVSQLSVVRCPHCGADLPTKMSTERTLGHQEF